MKARMVLDVLNMGIARRSSAKELMHSDRGTQYASDDYRSHLARFGVLPHMSRKGDCWDNAVA